MSAKIVIKSSMKDMHQIASALSAMGVPDNMVQVCPDGVEMNGYRGAKWGKVQVLIPKTWHGGYSDIGFAQQDDGTFSVLVDHIDDHSALRKVQNAVPGDSFGSIVNRWYAANSAKKALRDQGYEVTIRQQGKDLQVVGQQW